MRIFSSYKVRITDARSVNSVCDETAKIYQCAVRFILQVVGKEWDYLSTVEPPPDKAVTKAQAQLKETERLIHKTKENPAPAYPDFDVQFYKFPSYMRRAAIMEALGLVSSYKSNLANWDGKKKKPAFPSVGRSFPAMYRDNCFVRTGRYTAELKVFIRHTWDWIAVHFRKSDVDYIDRHCMNRKELAPTLRKRGRNWSLDFPFEERVELNNTKPKDATILSVDLGLNSLCVGTVMKSDGTILGRGFFSLPRAQDCLVHRLNKIKKSQRLGGRKNKLLWARVNHIRKEIAIQAMHFLADMAEKYDVDTVVFEYLNLNGKKGHSHWSQRLSLWQAKTLQKMVADSVHRLGIHVTDVNAKNTSKLAYDGSGEVTRGPKNHARCTFQTGKQYNCDLSASYNIGARYFIRELLKPLPEKARLAIQAKVPDCAKRTTCTLSTLIRLNAVLAPASH